MVTYLKLRQAGGFSQCEPCPGQCGSSCTSPGTAFFSAVRPAMAILLLPTTLTSSRARRSCPRGQEKPQRLRRSGRIGECRSRSGYIASSSDAVSRAHLRNIEGAGFTPMRRPWHTVRPPPRTSAQPSGCTSPTPKSGLAGRAAYGYVLATSHPYQEAYHTDRLPCDGDLCFGCETDGISSPRRSEVVSTMLAVAAGGLCSEPELASGGRKHMGTALLKQPRVTCRYRRITY